MAELAPDELFQAVLKELQLSMVIGPGIIKRSLAEAGVDVGEATRQHYLDSIERIETRLRNYLDANEAAARVRALRTLLEG